MLTTSCQILKRCHQGLFKPLGLYQRILLSDTNFQFLIYHSSSINDLKNECAKNVSIPFYLWKYIYYLHLLTYCYFKFQVDCENMVEWLKICKKDDQRFITHSFSSSNFSPFFLQKYWGFLPSGYWLRSSLFNSLILNSLQILFNSAVIMLTLFSNIFSLSLSILASGYWKEKKCKNSGQQFNTIDFSMVATFS